MAVDKRPDAEPIPGYRLIERLGVGGFGEVWKCEAPGGIFKAIKFVYGSLNSLDNSAFASEELRAVQLVKSIRHPFLLSIDRVESVSGELIIITELADRNLEELSQQYIAQRWSGIPRAELFRYLREVGEVLDLLNNKFDLQHLDIKPRNLFVVCNHVKVADFGLVNSLSGEVTAKLRASLTAVTPTYAAPELFQGKLSRHCDQYSLAIVYQELLTGTLPFNGKNLRQLFMQHMQELPDLQALPAHEREIVARALSKNPEDRFASCLDFVNTLAADQTPTSAADDSDSDFRFPQPSMPVPGSDTVTINGGETTRLNRSTAPVLPENVLTNHQFLTCIGNSPLLETWKTQTPDGSKKRVQLVYGLGGIAIGKLKEALARLTSMQHPALLMPQIAHVESGRVLLVTDWARQSLRDRLHYWQERKQPGVPRTELIDSLRATAEVLDYLYQQHNVQHLNLNPRNLVLDNGWLQLAEFGYAQLLWIPTGQDIAQRNARYAAPELFRGALGRHCDQYSLALIYAEMLTGIHPFQGLSPPVYLTKKMPPNLDRLPDLDREVIRRALSADPQQRWVNCTEMLLALEGIVPEVSKPSQARPDSFAALVEAQRDSKKKSVHACPNAADLHQIIIDLINAGGGNVTPLPCAEPSLDVGHGIVGCEFQAGLPLGAAQGRVESFCQKTFAKTVRQDESSCTMHFELPGTFWQQWWDRRPKLELIVQWSRVHPMSATPIEIKARLQALNCTKKKAIQLLETMSLDLLETLQQHLLIHSEKRTNDRLLWPHSVTVIPLDQHGHREEAIVCRGKDLSQTGIGFYLPHELSSAEILVEIPNNQYPPAVIIPAMLVRVKRCADGWYDVGAIFRLPTLRRAPVEGVIVSSAHHDER